MRYLNWLIRLFLFAVLITFAVRNEQPVSLRYYFGFEWQTSLVVILLVVFVLGIVTGLLAMLFSVLRHRRQIAALKRELRQKTEHAGMVGESGPVTQGSDNTDFN